MKTQIRIVAGSLRGRKLTCTVNAHLRPTPQRVREALFSILGNAVPGRPFVDVFAGTGVVGLEALSRGARSVTFVERDFRLGADLERRPEDLLSLVAGLQRKMAAGSVLVLQAERSPVLDELPDRERWDQRRYGRNCLLVWGPSEGPRLT